MFRRVVLSIGFTGFGLSFMWGGNLLMAALPYMGFMLWMIAMCWFLLAYNAGIRGR